MAYTTPKTNWTAQDVVQPADMNRIEQNIVELKKAATIDVVDANGYFTSSPKNVENVLQELGSAVTTGKNTIASAITAMGQSAASTDTYDTLSSKIRAISTDANAGTGDVLSGKTFYQGGSKKTGTMANNGVKIITPGASDIALSGYYASGSKVAGDPNLIASNILSGKSIFGVAGNVNKFLSYTQSNVQDIPYNTVNINTGIPNIMAYLFYYNIRSFYIYVNGCSYLLVSPYSNEKIYFSVAINGSVLSVTNNTGFTSVPVTLYAYGY